LLNLYESNEIDIDGIREEVDTFMFEGHDTTASAISFCLYTLARHPTYQKRLQDEIDSSKEENLSDRVQNIKFLDNVIKETARLFPPVPIIGRHFEEDAIINGRKIHKGTEVTLLVAALHRNENYWEDPDVFKPDRFNDDSCKSRNPFCYVPFSAGARNCIGQKYAMLEVKIFIYKILKNFDLKSSQSEDMLDLTAEIILKAKNGLMIEFIRR